MKLVHASATRGAFKILAQTRSAQLAVMTLPPGGTSGEVGNEHPRCEQWLWVLQGAGHAIINGRRVRLRQHSLLLIEKGELHQIVNSSRQTMRTLNLYAPPAYQTNGAVKPQAKRQ
jgi:mannose-6-phosphate isomerase-like protein (cupin superfamily)